MDRPALNEAETDARKQLVHLLRLVLSNHCSYLEAAPQIVCLQSQIGGVGDLDDDFRAFVVINSETDHLPLQATKRLWAEHAIRALEPEAARLETWAVGLARDSCEALLNRFAEADM